MIFTGQELGRYCDELHYGPDLETAFGPGFLNNLTKKKTIKDGRVEILLLGQHNKKYSSTPTICWKISRAFGTHPDSFIRLVKFAVIRSLILMRLQNCSINWGKVVARFISDRRVWIVYGFAYLAWKQVVFLAHKFAPRILHERRWFSWPKNLPRVSCTNAGGFPCSKISPVVQFLIWNIDLVWRAAPMASKKLSNRHISPHVQAKHSDNSILGRL